MFANWIAFWLYTIHNYKKQLNQWRESITNFPNSVITFTTKLAEKNNKQQRINTRVVNVTVLVLVLLTILSAILFKYWRKYWRQFSYAVSKWVLAILFHLFFWQNSIPILLSSARCTG